MTNPQTDNFLFPDLPNYYYWVESTIDWRSLWMGSVIIILEGLDPTNLPAPLSHHHHVLVVYRLGIAKRWIWEFTVILKPYEDWLDLSSEDEARIGLTRRTGLGLCLPNRSIITQFKTLGSTVWLRGTRSGDGDRSICWRETDRDGFDDQKLLIWEDSKNECAP